MCDVCRKNPCDPRCPNAEEPKVFDFCVSCRKRIYEFDDYFDIDGEPWCEECIEKSRKIAE